MIYIYQELPFINIFIIISAFIFIGYILGSLPLYFTFDIFLCRSDIMMVLMDMPAMMRCRNLLFPILLRKIRLYLIDILFFNSIKNPSPNHLNYLVMMIIKP